MPFPRLLPLAGVAALVASCGSFESPKRKAEKETPPRPGLTPAQQAEASYSFWDDQDHTGPVTVRIDLSEQTAYFFRSGKQVGRSRVATGLPEHRTPTGSFRITEKIADKRSNLYGRILNSEGVVVRRDADSRKHKVPKGGKFVGASMPYWMRLTSYGIGMHAGPIPYPGNPASHGCIRFPRHMAEQLFSKAPTGTRVKIVP